jgi:transcriptional regulator with XRE-family HTH domain
LDIRNSPLESAVVEVLKQRLADARLSQREAERTLGLKHGIVGNILRGRTALRIQHLELLGRLLDFTPDQILTEARGISESPADDELARRVASHVVEELLQRTTSMGSLVPTSPNS